MTKHSEGPVAPEDDPDRGGFVQSVRFARFRRGAFGFWCGRSGWVAWPLTGFLVGVALLQLLVQYLLNTWNLDFFNALERRDGATLWRQTLWFAPLVAASVLLAVVSVWGRMTAQRKWREFMTRHVIELWLAKGRFRKLNHLLHNGHENPEYRIAEDVRIATDAPVDMSLALFASIITAITFFSVLWQVGGDLDVPLFGSTVTIPGYLVLGAIVYSGLVTAGMVFIGSRLTVVIEQKNQAEAEFRAAATLIREDGEGISHAGSESSERRQLWLTLVAVLARWRDFCWQLMRTTSVSHTNFLLTPVVAWFLCAPKYLTGSMTLGELAQAAAAFVTVLGAFNWLVDNFQRFADWASSAERVATLLLALDEIAPEDEPATCPDGAEVSSAPSV